MASTPLEIGSILSLWRYPVKSMAGEELHSTEVTEMGLLGDRAYALVDPSNGKVVSAKNPKKWKGLFDLRAAFSETPAAGGELPPVRIVLPDGTTLHTAQDGVAALLSKILERPVRLDRLEPRPRLGVPSSPPPGPVNAEGYWPDIEGLDHRDMVTDFTLPEGTFFDSAFVHLLTTATLERLHELQPEGRFEVRRFRPNIVIEPRSGEKSFLEDSWIGRTLALGAKVRLQVTGPCNRCVMTTLPQGDLPRDLGILRAVAEHHRAQVGIYAAVVQGGTIRRGDPVRLVD